jgi:hypothetical protein
MKVVISGERMSEGRMCKHECCKATNALRANVFDDYSTTKFQLCNMNYEIGITQ